MVTNVVLPQMGLEVSEGTVVAFHVTAGASVSEGDPLLEVETDKALTDVVAPCDGVVLGFDVQEGDTVPVGAVLVRLGDSADATSSTGDDVQGAVAEQAPAAEVASSPALSPSPERAGGDTASDRVLVGVGAAEEPSKGAHAIKAAPVARRAARHHGIALTSITGTGPRGRITLRDVEQAVAGATNGKTNGTSNGDGAPDGDLEPMSATRRAIARRMTESQRIPQFALDREIDATWLLAEKRRLTDEGPVKVTVNDLLLQALAEMVVRHPDLGTSFVDGDRAQVRRRAGADVGLAVATDRGLLVPVLRRLHERTLGELALERSRLVTAARSGKLDLAEMTGATISLSSLASFGVDRFTAMLNPGEAAIVAVGRTVDKVVPRDRGFAVVPALTLTMTLDHRVVDGATGARALAELAELLEGEMTWRT